MGVTHHGRTQRLDLADPTLREWECTVVWSDPADPEAGIVLDRSAFYPGGGGQPPDHGVLLWQGVQTRIVGTRKGDDLYLIPRPGDPVPPRRHRGAAARSRTTGGRCSCAPTPGCTCCAAWSSATSARWSPAATWSPARPGWTSTCPRCRPTSRPGWRSWSTPRSAPTAGSTYGCCGRDEALALPDIIRTQSNLIPADEQEIRIVDIVGLDVQADGGTHVASTRQIGRVSVVKVESKGKANRRVRVRLSD